MDTLGQGMPSLREVSRIQGRGLVQVVVPSLDPFSLYIFRNGEFLNSVSVEDICVQIALPDSGNLADATINGMLTYKAGDVTGKESTQAVELFPGTVDFNLMKHRLVISCGDADNLATVTIQVGLTDEGVSYNLEGMKALEILISNGIVDVKVTWQDDNMKAGRQESLFRESVVVN